MKWSINQLRKHQDAPLNFETDVEFSHLINNLQLIDLSPVHVGGTLSAKAKEVYADIVITGHYVMSCARTLEPVEVPFHIESLEVFDMNDYQLDAEDINRHEIINGMIDLKPVVEELVVLEKPVRVVKEDTEMSLTKGKGWEVVDEDQLQQEPAVDPRLAKLQDLL
ncbi:DUF177 domain-containing protein [Macrococcus hajekii]|uniref:DUF177 domain-containing protein n=1 Tax=Macrococcus hajekii TaxID=198482 RepID=A0A4R6BNL2_9STAP|nr:YceD family protein [Macrococcus hajekii]TDM03287.1 DUF177 domain-containing protein [Macrococcus hajekii]GGA97605.1 DNA-binding protein [Macrococcus hajekii]